MAIRVAAPCAWARRSELQGGQPLAEMAVPGQWGRATPPLPVAWGGVRVRRVRPLRPAGSSTGRRISGPDGAREPNGATTGGWANGGDCGMAVAGASGGCDAAAGGTKVGRPQACAERSAWARATVWCRQGDQLPALAGEVGRVSRLSLARAVLAGRRKFAVLWCYCASGSGRAVGLRRRLGVGANLPGTG